MTWGWLTAIIQGLLAGLNQWLASQQARSDQVTLGQQEQAVADTNAKAAAEAADAQQAAKADNAASAVLVGAVASPGSLRDPDPDSRD